MKFPTYLSSLVLLVPIAWTVKRGVLALRELLANPKAIHEARSPSGRADRQVYPRARVRKWGRDQL